MSDSDSSEGDWEEVNEADYDLPKQEEEEEDVREYTQHLDIPNEGIQITIEGGEGGAANRAKKKFDVEGYIRRAVNRRKKELQEDLHKSHLLCLLSSFAHINTFLINEEILAVGLSVLPSKQSYPPKNIDLIYLENFNKWFKKTFKVMSTEEIESSKNEQKGADFKSKLIRQINCHKVEDAANLVYVFIVILRALGVHVRLIQNLQPISLKPSSSELVQGPSRKTKSKKAKDDASQDDELPTCSNTTKSTKKNQSTKSAACSKKPRNEPKAKKAKRETSKTPAPSSSKLSDKSFSSPSEDSDVDSDFDLDRSLPRKRRQKPQQGARAKSAPVRGGPKSKKAIGKGRKMISSDEDTDEKETEPEKKPTKPRQYFDTWAEVYLEEEERWVSVDLVSQPVKVMCDNEFEAKATPPVIYVLAYGNDKRVKDVTRRYASKWLTGTQKKRVDRLWWQKALKPLVGRRNRRDKEEDELLDQHLMNQPVPATVQEVKGHPLFAMKRHLLKFEAIYPLEPPPLGFIKNEAVFSRDCIKTLHTREQWMKKAKVVRIGEKPYKVVKARPKWDKNSSTVIKDRPLELFGEWQVEDYIPPPAQDGKVPRNEYGNVELFLPKMLPKGTVHLKEPGMSRIAKKLNIDCAPALVGFEFHTGGSHPTYDGCIVCEEFKDILLDAWREDYEEARRREEEKRTKRVRGNWKRLIRLVIVRRRLEKKYASFNFGAGSSKQPSQNNDETTSSTKPENKYRKRKRK